MVRETDGPAQWECVVGTTHNRVCICGVSLGMGMQGLKSCDGEAENGVGWKRGRVGDSGNV